MRQNRSNTLDDFFFDSLQAIALRRAKKNLPFTEHEPATSGTEVLRSTKGSSIYLTLRKKKHEQPCFLLKN